MPTSQINALPSPTDQSPNQPYAHFDALIGVLDSRLVPRFSDAAARNAAITSPQVGMVAMVAGTPMSYTSAGWRHLRPALISSMTARPSADLYAGYPVRPLDRPNLVYTYDGARWVQEGVFADVSAAPAGSYITNLLGTATATIIAGSGTGAYTINLPAGRQFSGLIRNNQVAGDTTEGLADVQPGPSTGTVIGGFGYMANGVPIAAGKTIRINYDVLGYNT